MRVYAIMSALYYCTQTKEIVVELTHQLWPWGRPEVMQPIIKSEKWRMIPLRCQTTLQLNAYDIFQALLLVGDDFPRKHHLRLPLVIRAQRSETAGSARWRRWWRHTWRTRRQCSWTPWGSSRGKGTGKAGRNSQSRDRARAPGAGNVHQSSGQSGRRLIRRRRWRSSSTGGLQQLLTSA